MATRKQAASPAPVIAARGEVVITLEGVVYPLRPSFAAIGEIETALGLSLYELTAAAETARLTLAQAGVIVSACIRAHARDAGNAQLATMRPERASELIYGEIGGVLAAVRGSIQPLLLMALTGGYTPAGFRQPQTTVNPTSDRA